MKKQPTLRVVFVSWGNLVLIRNLVIPNMRKKSEIDDKIVKLSMKYPKKKIPSE